MEIISNMSTQIQNHTEPLYRITPAKLISSKDYDKEKYLEMLLDSPEAVFSVFGFSSSF